MKLAHFKLLPPLFVFCLLADNEARRGLQPRRLRFVRRHGIRYGTKRYGRDYKSRPAGDI